MTLKFTIPNLGENITEATIVRWLVDDGASVAEGDDLLELETDKAVIPVPAPASGILRRGPFNPGDMVAVGAVVAEIETTPAPETDKAAASPAPAAAPAPAPAAEPVARATPLARKMAASLGVSLNAVQPSTGSRITGQDVVQAAGGPEPEPAPASEPAPAPAPAPAEDVTQTIPVKGIRGVIARRMAESVHTTARVTLVSEVDATELVALRERLKARYADEWGFAPGYNDLLAVMVAAALKEFPYMNARFSADGQNIEWLAPVHLGMAVDTDRGLLVVVIRDANRKSLRQIGAEFRELVARARAGKSTPDDLSGSTFTISNLGMYRVDAFTPVINLPEAAILGVGRIQPKPVARGDEVVIRKMLTLSLVVDHRMIDGAPAARFLDYLSQLIEDPSFLFLTRR